MRAYRLHAHGCAAANPGGALGLGVALCDPDGDLLWLGGERLPEAPAHTAPLAQWLAVEAALSWALGRRRASLRDGRAADRLVIELRTNHRPAVAAAWGWSSPSGAAGYSALDLIRSLREAGAEVRVVEDPDPVARQASRAALLGQTERIGALPLPPSLARP